MNEKLQIEDVFEKLAFPASKEDQADLESRLLNEGCLEPIITWRGIAFENLCFNHIQQIKSALGIPGVASRQSAWSKRGDDIEGAQIDLLIDRNDNIINMCELKYYGDEFTVNKEYYKKLLHRQELLSAEIPKRYAIHNTLITTFGLTYNEYSGIFSNVITLDELFR